MSAASDCLLLNFRRSDSVVRVTRKTLKAMAMRLGVSETQVVHLALSKFAVETVPGYEPDDGPLTAQQLAAFKADAGRRLPKSSRIDQRWCSKSPPPQMGVSCSEPHC